MRALTRKLLRDLWQTRSQVATVSLVAASAFAGFAGSLATYDSLIRARDSFYESAQFGDVFLELKRAPRAMEREIADIPGVVAAEATVAFDVTLDVAGVSEPVVGRLIGMPDDRPSAVDRLTLRRGRGPHPAGRDTEVVVSEGFAGQHDLAPGRSLSALVNGTRETLRIVGVGLSPDYVYATRGGAFPDDRSFGVLWMQRSRLATAYEMEGAFNYVAVRLAPDASRRAVADALDRMFEPYGGTGAYARDEQLSHRILTQEIDQWKVIGTLIPSIFLAVTAFLLHVVLNRHVATQRGQIAALKALGYGNGAVAMHYLAQVLVIGVLATLIGTAVGAWFGRGVTALYAAFFHFPAYRFAMPTWIVLAAAAITFAAAGGGAAGALRTAVRLAPAEAMRPPYPGRYRPTLLERSGLRPLLTPAMRMTVRNLERRPWRAALTTLGIASAMAIVITGMFWRDALDYMMDVQFDAAQRADAQIALVEPLGERAEREIARMPGVMRAEGSREAPARLSAGPRSYRSAIQGIAAGDGMRRLLDRDLNPVAIPPEGVLLTDRLAERLGVRVGDALRIELLTGERAQRTVPVAGTVHDLIGLNAYMDLGALNRLVGDGAAASSISVRLAAPRDDALYRRLKEYPHVATVASKAAMVQNFRDTSARNVLFFTSVLTAFAAVIAVGVVYNIARIALQERAWELASLRVLGFTRAEVSTFLLGELAVEMLAALPFGALIGYLLAWTMVRSSHTDMIAIPIVIAPRTYAVAALAIVVAGVASALMVRRRIDRLDLVAVLKAQE